jgi:hypothetical protein
MHASMFVIISVYVCMSVCVPLCMFIHACVYTCVCNVCMWGGALYEVSHITKLVT